MIRLAALSLALAPLAYAEDDVMNDFGEFMEHSDSLHRGLDGFPAGRLRQQLT